MRGGSFRDCDEVDMLKDMHNRLRPMGLADILDETVDIYKNNFALLIGITALVYVPFSLASSVFKIRVPLSFDLKMRPEQALQIMKSMAPLAVISLFLMLIIIPLVTGALTMALSERYLDRRITIEQVYRRVFRRNVFFPFLCAFLLKYAVIGVIYFSSIMILVGILVIVPMIGTWGLLLAIPFSLAVVFAMAYVWLRFMLVEPAFIVEMRGIGNAVKRSWILMSGSAGRAFVLVLIAGMVMLVISGVLSAPIEAVIGLRVLKQQSVPEALYVMDAVFSTAANVLTVPLYSIVVILLYYDLRIRKEGFDLELLASEMNAGSRQITQELAPAPSQQSPPSDNAPQDNDSPHD